MSEPLPALCLIAVPGRRRRTIELGQEAERRGFAGIYVPSLSGNMSQCEALAWNTERSRSAPPSRRSTQRTMVDFAQSAAMMHEVSGGRFRLGIGIAHGPSHVRMGVTPGKPLADTRAFVEKFRAETGVRPAAADHHRGAAQEDGGAGGRARRGRGVRQRLRCSHMGQSLAALPAAKRNDAGFFIGNMIPTCISDDVEAAKAVNRRTLTHYAFLPNYRNYWKEAGYVEEMDGDREGASPRAAATTCRSISPTGGWPTSRCSARPPRCARASRRGARRACTRRSSCRPRPPATR